ncbi:MULTISPECIES: glyceraldehyde-3-phosphate dehydrogenase [Kocuria]|nr:MULTISPECIES: glyceraldehyde-3-phosphate dehydrogenase [Kocuria]WIW67864.1 glyceraldehyde-3-phosphate dehydrogenase [Kocuria sp. ChxB]MCG7423902.1 glyceraldehyde-3-phosphate dehydrogenase [Kocuria rhizophila]MCT1879798.1 glyceraldehyde-3-phosphate dehydrogenase [Kocuria rhizophila]MCT1958346.1 glyceraldehyde-3-phosphate dehydrogenase [Kocuria rhizophila]MCT2073766.1 glyceraldehyde-3-phosphate dehydrogenase [Kocuria rhizophila]
MSATWSEREALAEQLVPLVGQLHRNNKVVTTVFGRSLVHKSVTDIIKVHRFARRIMGEEMPLEKTVEIVTALGALNLGVCNVDVAKLYQGFTESGSTDLDGYLREALAPAVDQHGSNDAETRDVVLYGFGRIGRLLARILLNRNDGTGLNLRAVVVRKKPGNDLVKRASLLRRDSVHGSFDGTITVDEENNVITANGVAIQFIYANSPEEIDYTAYGIHDALVVDNTGVWRDEEGLSQHLRSKGVGKVLLTAPGKGEMKNIVCGVNDQDIDPEDTIISAASCTTNAITPVIKVLNDEYGIVQGHVETVHSYTNDQNLIDNWHKGDRRGRSAALNMVITETGAAKAVAKALPVMKGKLTGNAIRVPTPDVSMAILNLQLENAPESAEQVNMFLKDISLNSAMRKQIDYVDSPDVVSTDLVGSRRAGVVDGLATIVNNNSLVLYVWYDNEFGYSCQVVRVMARMADISMLQLP